MLINPQEFWSAGNWSKNAVDDGLSIIVYVDGGVVALWRINVNKRETSGEMWLLIGQFYCRLRGVGGAN